MNNNKKAAATMAALGAQVIFGFSFMFTKIGLSYATPLTVIANRYMVALLGLTLVMLVTKTKLNFRKGLWKLVLMSLFQPLLYFVFESYGISMSTSSFSAIMIAMIPVVAMVSGIFTLGEIPSVRQYLFAALSVAGVVIAAMSSKAEGTATFAGILLLAGAVASSVAYNITSRKISGEFTVFERTYAMTVIGALSFSLIAFIENAENPVSIISSFVNLKYTVSVFYLGIFSSVIAFLLLNFANTHLPVAKTTAFSNLTTVVSVIAGVVFLKERITTELIVATVMIVTGVLGVQLTDTVK